MDLKVFCLFNNTFTNQKRIMIEMDIKQKEKKINCFGTSIGVSFETYFQVTFLQFCGRQYCSKNAVARPHV